MENKIYNDDVERIVNEKGYEVGAKAYWQTPVEFHEKRNHKRQSKMAVDFGVYVSLAIAFAIIGFFGFMATWMAYPVAIACGLYAAFVLGRFVENRNCWGCR